MKKFKKSLVILPALATLALTTVASITGTVAWFTANREASVTASQFKVGTNEGDLKVSWTEGVGVTQASGGSDSKATINVTDGVVLLDASYDGSDLTDEKPFWTDVENGDENNKYQQVSQQYNSSSKYYYGLSWMLTFTVAAFNADKTTYDIFFDVSGSDKTVSGTKTETATAFRVSMGSGDNRIIWAPNSSLGTVNKTGYVSSANNTTNYESAGTSKHGSICNEDNTGLKTPAIEVLKKTKNDTKNIIHIKKSYLVTNCQKV